MSSSPMEIPRRSSGAQASELGAGYSVSPATHMTGTPPASPNLSQVLDIDVLDKSGHQLNTAWTFYFDRTVYGTTPADYVANLKKIYTVHCVESFWGIYNNIPSPGQIQMRCGYHLMRGTRKPMWEDVPEGGSWKFRVPKSCAERVWKELLLAVIGEQFSGYIHKDDQICGVSISTRQADDILQVWNLKSELAPQGKVIDKIRDLVPDVQIQTTFYKSHQETLKKGR
ncbi:eukaryotic translation initiation factor 4E type 3-B-like [Sycon ciliatum]|uniref:eukaryotic translation initiation factor 4E type 3-B-like n=1 Tax=Sycon ciliatum TaxID=27933 RepID=UPI0020AA825B|eukprot:scpid77807/ scgid32027/ Eukaryotic translation initiation factor 4E type 3